MRSSGVRGLTQPRTAAIRETAVLNAALNLQSCLKAHSPGSRAPIGVQGRTVPMLPLCVVALKHHLASCLPIVLLRSRSRITGKQK